MIQSGYTKLFGSIVASTIWREDDKTRIVWITLLALSDKDGFVASSIPGLADLARVSIPECERALEKLQQPDPYSRSQEHDGRRIEVIDGGWYVINRAKYRDLGSADEQREQARARKQAQRERQRGSGSPDVTHGVTHDRDMSRMSLQKEKEKEKEEEISQNPSSDVTTSDQERGPASQAKAKKPKALYPEAERLASLLAAEIRRNKADYRITPAQLRAWAVTADRMLRLDGRAGQQIADLIRWVQADEFWISNVLSMDKLREQFDKLELKRSRSQAPTTSDYMTATGYRPLKNIFTDNPATRAKAMLEGD